MTGIASGKGEGDLSPNRTIYTGGHNTRKPAETMKREITASAGLLLCLSII